MPVKSEAGVYFRLAPFVVTDVNEGPSPEVMREGEQEEQENRAPKLIYNDLCNTRIT